MFEIWRLSRADLDRILSRQLQSELRKAAREQGVRSLAEDGLAKAEDGITSIDEVRRRCDASGAAASSASNGGGRRNPSRRAASRRRGLDGK